ncbi:endonuclease/exonuclease/phosphatase family protein [Lysobacter humi (ex Lee et al. 2017)]
MMDVSGTARATLVTALGLAMAMISTAAVAAKVHVVDHNIAGDRSGDSKGKKRWAGVAAEARRGADVLTMQEVCSEDLKEIRTELRPLGWKFEFVRMRTKPECGGDGEKGLVIAARSRLANVKAEPLKVDGKLPGQAGYIGSRAFFLLCADVPQVNVPGMLRLCTTHLWAGDASTDAAKDLAIRAQQAQQIAAILKPQMGNRKIVLTGDFNSTPDSDAMDALYRVTRNGGLGSAESGKFWEVDQVAGNKRVRRGGRNTLLEKRKIDYIFASTKGVNPYEGVELTRLYIATHNGRRLSTHKLLRAWIDFKQ